VSEFDIPRLGSRIDAVVVAGATVLPIEFKIGEAHFDRCAHDQAWDYALDLKNFHAASQGHDLSTRLRRRWPASWRPAGT
jgi:hypothetical protein